MRHIRTNHNPLTVSDILLENGTARLEDFYPLTKVKTASDNKEAFIPGLQSRVYCFRMAIRTSR